MTSATAFPVFQIFLFLALSDLWVCLRFHTAFSPLVLCCLFLVSLSPAQGKSLSRVRVFATPWTVAYEVPPSMGFSRQEYWNGLGQLQKSELKWIGMGEFNSDDHYIYYCRQESLRRNGVALIVNKRVWNVVLGCKLKNNRRILVHFQGKPLSITVIQVYSPTTNAKKV